MLSGENLSFVEASLSYVGLMSDSTPRPPSLLGDGLLYARHIGHIHGPDGARKSWEILHLVVDASVGRPHWGFSTRSGGIRCGLISLEDDMWMLRDRLGAIVQSTDADEDLLEENLRVICPPRYEDPWDIVDLLDQAAIRTWIGEEELELIVIDHLSKAHELQDERDLRPVSNAALAIARACSCGILFVHHDRKGQPGSRNRTDPGASRGDSRFSADCRLRIGMKEIKDRILLDVEKCTGRRRPEAIWLQQGENGVLILTDPPATRSEEAARRREQMLEIVSQAGPGGVAPRALAAELEVSERTISGYAREFLEQGLILRIGRAQGTRYMVPNVRELSGPSSAPELTP
ncbi:MAG: AAA family ATPase [Candidatus Eisenbacteria sp.]|nr:AAA family ATPase [Candidatus Eisenbacteria bacterium]